MTEDKMRKDFEAIIAKDCGDLSTFGTGANVHYKNSYVNHEWIGYKMGYRAATRAAVPAWQPIETAPKDGTVVLARIPDSDVQQAVMWSAKEGCWVIQWDHWKLRGLDAPTHWMRLPEVE